MNLDGGGSTTFVLGGAVANRPSDRLVRRKGREQIVHLPTGRDVVVGPVERPVAIGFAVVPAPTSAPPPVDPLSGPRAEIPIELALPAPVEDPGSDPSAGRPALVATVPHTGVGARLVATAILLNLAAAAGAGALVRRLPAPPARRRSRRT